jgi:transcriptional regulator with XRE-family HTH domain
MPIPFNIKRRLKENGWTLEILAEKTGLSIQTLSKIQNGNENTTLRSLALIARAFGVGIKDLFDDPSNTEYAILKKD